jgi:hypothetical protein
MLKKFECLNKITFFGRFREAKIFRKWKMVSQASQRSITKVRVESAVKKVYRDVYCELASLLEMIRKYKFISASKVESLALS